MCDDEEHVALVTAQQTPNPNPINTTNTVNTVNNNPNEEVDNEMMIHDTSQYDSSIYQHLELEEVSIDGGDDNDNISPNEFANKNTLKENSLFGKRNVRIASIIMTLALLVYVIINKSLPERTTKTTTTASPTSSNTKNNNRHTQSIQQTQQMSYYTFPNQPTYSIFPKKMYTVVGLESSGTTFTTSLLTRALNNAPTREGTFQYSPPTKEAIPTQVQHCSLPQGNTCSATELAPILDKILPASCSTKPRPTIEQQRQHQQQGYTQGYTQSFSKECETIASEVNKPLPFKYPGRFFLDLVQHKQYYDKHNTQQYIVIVVRDQSISLASREHIHCHYHAMAQQETERGLDLIQKAIDAFILNPKGEYALGINGGFDSGGFMNNVGHGNDQLDENGQLMEEEGQPNGSAGGQYYGLYTDGTQNGGSNMPIDTIQTEHDHDTELLEGNTRKLKSKKLQQSTPQSSKDQSTSQSNQTVRKLRNLRDLKQALETWDTHALTRHLHTHYQNSNYLPNGNGVVIVSYELMNQLGQPYIQMLYRTLGIQSDYIPMLKDGNKKYTFASSRQHPPQHPPHE